MNREQTLSHLQLPLELIDLIASYDSYELFDYYGMKKTCPIIQQMIQTKQNIHLLLSEKARNYYICDEHSFAWCTYTCKDQSKKIYLDYSICGHCGNYQNGIDLYEFHERDFFQDRRVCRCYLGDDFLEDLSEQADRNYML